jgi:hypothetical protein
MSTNLAADNVPGRVRAVLPQKTSNRAEGEGRTRTIEHQRFDEFHTANTKNYDVWEREGRQRFHADLPAQTIWGYGEKQPDGTIRPRRHPDLFTTRAWRTGLRRMHNDLPLDHIGFGRAETSTHLHNGHSASESDGNPLDSIPSGQGDHHYPNILAGFDDPAFASDPITGAGQSARDDEHAVVPRPPLRLHGSERLQGVGRCTAVQSPGLRRRTRSQPARVPPPSGEFDVPMVLGDKAFDLSTGEMFFDFFNLDGILGDKFTVNGVIQPFMQVQPRTAVPLPERRSVPLLSAVPDGHETAGQGDRLHADLQRRQSPARTASGQQHHPGGRRTE